MGAMPRHKHCATLNTERRLRLQIHALDSWARTADRSARTLPARQAAWDRFEKQVDPEGKLPPAQRAAMAECVRKAHLKRMALRVRRGPSSAQRGGCVSQLTAAVVVPELGKFNIQLKQQPDDWVPYGYRVIPGWTNYMMSAELDVWSMPRQVRCKGDRTRHTPPKQLKPSDGRVTLCHDGRTRRFHVERELSPLVFIAPRRQGWCRKHHPLMETRTDYPPILKDRFGKPHIITWGTGNRICLRCHQPGTLDNGTYSLQYGVAGMPEYTNLPAQPKPFNARQLAELEWDDYGYSIQ
jgi:hypothetical protein